MRKDKIIKASQDRIILTLKARETIAQDNQLLKELLWEILK